MIKTIIVCDVCGREINGERFEIKHRCGIVGTCDVCRTCFERITGELKNGTPSREEVFIKTVKAAVRKHKGSHDGTQTDVLDREFHRTVCNALVEYGNARIGRFEEESTK